MRTIDFRGKAVGSGRWVHGDLVWMGRQPAIFEYADFENGCVTIQEKTLGMNTGLKDKNGHEIYDGDILAHNGRVIGHVVDGVRGYCFDVVYADPVSTSTWSLYGVVVNDYEGDVEIVGNIYDNHEWREGYHVQYTNPDGSTYDSWSPKSVFEQAYKCADSFIDRLQIEHDELKERYNKLDNFLESGKAEKVCEENQIWLMALQRINMQNYLGNLATRLKFLKDAPFQTQG